MIDCVFVEAMGLARRGANVVLACRNIPAAEQAAYEITQQTHNRNVHVEPLNLADISSIRDFAKRFKLKFSRLDILINNAGIILL
jgi:NAD(P)-dependent dehydrogenase (short-subunit alcohol dehydrogenase family)